MVVVVTVWLYWSSSCGSTNSDSSSDSVGNSGNGGSDYNSGSGGTSSSGNDNRNGSSGGRKIGSIKITLLTHLVSI